MNFGHSGTEERLRKQWVKQGAILPAATTQQRSLTPVELNNKRRLRILYALLGLSICTMGTGLVLLLIY